MFAVALAPSPIQRKTVLWVLSPQVTNSVEHLISGAPSGPSSSTLTERNRQCSPDICAVALILPVRTARLSAHAVSIGIEGPSGVTVPRSERLNCVSGSPVWSIAAIAVSWVSNVVENGLIPQSWIGKLSTKVPLLFTETSVDDQNGPVAFPTTWSPPLNAGGDRKGNLAAAEARSVIESRGKGARNAANEAVLRGQDVARPDQGPGAEDSIGPVELSSSTEWIGRAAVNIAIIRAVDVSLYNVFSGFVVRHEWLQDGESLIEANIIEIDISDLRDDVVVRENSDEVRVVA